jgi:hypothetical protein
MWLLTAASLSRNRGLVKEHIPSMTSSRLLRFFAVLSLLSSLAALWLWHATGEPPDRWLVRLSVAGFLAAVLTSLVDADTRPRVMLRFLAALFALFALIAFAADVSHPATEGQRFHAVSLMQHLQALAPSFLAALERSISRSIGPFVWDPILTSILGLPASLIFLVLAIAAGFAGRPRRRVRIFVNDI